MLYNRAGTSVIATLTNAFDVQWQDQLSDVGFGKFSLALSDAEAALVAVGQHVRCRIYDSDNVFAWRIETVIRTRIAADEEHGQILEASGRGGAVRLGDAKVYPPLGVAQAPAIETRSFSFASPDYDQTGWVSATEIAPFGLITNEWTGIDDTGVKIPAPFGWRLDFGAGVTPAFPQWIWNAISETATGNTYFRQTYTFAAATNVTIDVTGDNFYTFYLDGAALLGDNTNPECWQEHRRVQLEMQPGVHTFAAVVRNIRPSPAAFLFAMYIENDPIPVDDQTDTPVPPTMLMVSDSWWKCLGYPAVEPGFTPGQILLILIAEFQARGQLLTVQAGFTGSHDSAGVAWTPMPEFGVDIGTSLLDVVNEMVATGWIEWHLAPQGDDGMEILSAWKAETPGPARSTVFAADVNIVDISHATAGREVNRLLVKYGDGLFVLDDLVSQAAVGEIIEEYLTLDAADRNEAVALASRALADITVEDPAITVSLEPAWVFDRPYLDFTIGDRVMCPNEDAVLTWYRVLGMTVTQDDMGDPSTVVELNRRTFNLQAVHESLFHTLGSGIIGDMRGAEVVPELIAEGD